MTKKKTLWLRSETKEYERRTPLTPEGAKELINANIDVRVESCPNRIFKDSDYKQAGIPIVPRFSWKTEASQEAIILGLKELENEVTPLSHQHIYFAHAFKGQDEAHDILTRFQKGNGKLYDLEFLVDQNNRRVCAFGRWAGFVGAAIGLKHHLNRQLNLPLEKLKSYEHKDLLLNEIQEKLNKNEISLTSMVIGAKGRCGRGALEVFKAFNLPCLEWDYEETQKGGPFKEILDVNLFVNTVLLTSKIPPFITPEVFYPNQPLKVISDVSCDPNNPHNPIPLYDKITSWDEPFCSQEYNHSRVEILAVDNLPSVLPKESSEDFSQQLLPHLKELLTNDGLPPVWEKAYQSFINAKKEVLN